MNCNNIVNKWNKDVEKKCLSCELIENIEHLRNYKVEYNMETFVVGFFNKTQENQYCHIIYRIQNIEI